MTEQPRSPAVTALLRIAPVIQFATLFQLHLRRNRRRHIADGTRPMAHGRTLTVPPLCGLRHHCRSQTSPGQFDGALKCLRR
jgi:hypothetical protein